MPVPFPRFLQSGLLAVGVAAACIAPLPAAQIPTEVPPGPREMTADEKSLAADPARGSEHGIVLANETDRNDGAGTDAHVWRRFRAKVFSNEGRGLADVEIPFSEGAKLQKWWGWTLLPDGTVLELKKEDLREQVLATSGGEKLSVLKGALPGVVPGCVIEYGYLLWERGIYSHFRVELQGSWPIRQFRYHWTPWGGKVASYRVSRAEGLAVEVKQDSRSFQLTGKDLPAVVEEPFMPPMKEVRAAATFYYRSTSELAKEFWNLEAKRESGRAAQFNREKPLKAALAEMNLPPGGSLTDRLKAVHGWLATHVKLSNLRSAEEEAEGKDNDKDAASDQEVLQSRLATGREMDYLFLGFARLLGADAYMVLATDRTDHFFDPALLSVEQFDWSLVAIHLPGEPSDKFILVDNGAGVAYGELPWWVMGGRGLLADPQGAKVLSLPASSAGRNLSDSKATVSFNLEEGTAAISWSRTDSGQAGLSERLSLRRMSPEKRQKRIEELCGSSDSFETVQAEAPGLEDLNRGMRLECKGTLTGTNFTGQFGRYSFRFDGPWEEDVPDLSAPSRVHPVIFDFPRVDESVIEIQSPPGYATTPPPTVAPIESPYGHYALFITANPEGYHVERVFSISTVGAPAKDYETLRRFLTAVRQADHTAVEFRKAGTTP